MGAGKLDGKVAVITGAASGIGRAIAVAFAAEGARVVGADLNAQGLRAIEGERIVAVPTDVTLEGEVKSMVEMAVSRFGRIDVLFNNAGLGDYTPIESLEDGQFERIVRVHLFGGLYGLRAAMPVMRRQGHGRIVNTLSRGAETAAPCWAAYGSAKAGLFALTRVAAAECAGTDVLVNGMIPGPTRTGMMKGEGLQEPEAVVPSALWLATLPAGGPSGKAFWNMQEYHLFAN